MSNKKIILNYGVEINFKQNKKPKWKQQNLQTEQSPHNVLHF
jgi:hypothetical protein